MPTTKYARALKFSQCFITVHKVNGKKTTRNKEPRLSDVFCNFLKFPILSLLILIKGANGKQTKKTNFCLKETVLFISGMEE